MGGDESGEVTVDCCARDTLLCGLFEDVFSGLWLLGEEGLDEVVVGHDLASGGWGHRDEGWWIKSRSNGSRRWLMRPLLANCSRAIIEVELVQLAIKAAAYSAALTRFASKVDNAST